MAANYKHNVVDFECTRCGNYVLPDEAHKYCFAGDLEHVDEILQEAYDPSNVRTSTSDEIKNREFFRMCVTCKASKSENPLEPNADRVIRGNVAHHNPGCDCQCHQPVERIPVVDSIVASLRARARQHMVRK